MPQVSVVIPLYNKGQYIRRALDSVCAQTFDDFEVIVVDDGSTDDGPEIVKSYGDSRIRLIHQANAGPGAARNRGVKESTVPYLAFLDADDEWLPDFLRVSMESLENHPECTVSIVSRYQDLLRKDITPQLRKSGIQPGIWSLHENTSVASYEKIHPPFFTGAIMCKREDFERLGGFYDKKRTLCGEDTYLWLQFAMNFKVFVILEPLVWYHSEASELGHCWADAGVVQPQYSDPGLIRRNCPQVHRFLLEELLTAQALRRASQLCERQDVDTARQICLAFPAMKQSLWKYSMLRMGMACPKVYRMFRRAASLRRSIAIRILQVLDFGEGP